MADRLPSIDIAVRGSPRVALLAMAETARNLGVFQVDVEENFDGEEDFDIANLRFRGVCEHSEPRIQLVSRRNLVGRVAVQAYANGWMPDDPPTFTTYSQMARKLTRAILKAYNAAHSTRYRLRVQTQKSMVPKLPQASNDLFKRFVAQANTSSLHPLNWGRFYQFVSRSRAPPLHEEDMATLLNANGFVMEYAERIAAVYVHLCEFKAYR